MLLEPCALVMAKPTVAESTLEQEIWQALTLALTA